MADRKTKGGHPSGDMPVSELAVPDVMFRPGAGTADVTPAFIGPTVPDRPCPKCGSADVSIAYCDGCELRPYSSKYDDDKCGHGDLEHMHRRCKRCSYQWRTDDVLNPRKVCKQ